MVELENFILIYIELRVQHIDNLFFMLRAGNLIEWISCKVLSRFLVLKQVLVLYMPSSMFDLHSVTYNTKKYALSVLYLMEHCR